MMDEKENESAEDIKQNKNNKKRRDSIYFCIKDTIFIYLCSCK